MDDHPRAYAPPYPSYGTSMGEQPHAFLPPTPASPLWGASSSAPLRPPTPASTRRRSSSAPQQVRAQMEVFEWGRRRYLTPGGALRSGAGAADGGEPFDEAWQQSRLIPLHVDETARPDHM